MATRRRKKADEDDPRWWEALHKAQDWDEQGLSHRKIAGRLNKEGYTLGRGRYLWTDTAVTRALDRHPKHPVEYPVKWPAFDWEDPDSAIEVTVYGDDGAPKDRKKEIGTAHGAGDFPGETETERQANYEAFKREIAHLASVPIDRSKEPKRAYPEPKPRDWTEGSVAYANTLDYRNTWAVGEKKWDEEIVPMVVEQARQLGWSFLDRLDRLTGDPTDLAKLRWAYLGMMRRLALREETVIALKAQVAELRAKIEG